MAKKADKKKQSKKDKNQNTSVNFEADAPDFIPYACHFDDHTLLTKNGELMQTIKVTGFSFESVHAEDDTPLSVRDAIRDAIVNTIELDGFALWFHTIRRQHDLSHVGEFNNFYANQLNDDWNAENRWDKKFINEVYVTIIHEGQALNFTDIKAFFRSIYFPAEFRHRMNYLEGANEHLHIISKQILDLLGSYGARRLKIVRNPDGLYYSQLLRFLGKIVNLDETNIPVTPIDISETLASHKTFFGNNTIKVIGHTGQHYGAILTIKEYHNIALKAVDQFLQQNHEFIVTEIFDFVNQDEALEKFKSQEDFYRISEEKKLPKISGLTDILDSDTGRKTDFGEHQISILMLGNSLEEMESATSDAVKAFNNLGIVVIREDIMMEDCYWAQLPGNFEFCKRMSPIATRHIAGYCSLYNFPAGRISNNHWGEAVTVFSTAHNTPYFFNFHYEENGHSFIIGPYNSGKTVLLNFLIAQSMKFSPRLFYLDRNQNSAVFIGALGGKYTQLTRLDEGADIRFNPLKIEHTEKHYNFLILFFTFLITPDHTKLSKKQKIKITKAVDYTFSLPMEERRLSNIIPQFWSAEDDGNELGTIDDEKIQQNEGGARDLGSLLNDDEQSADESADIFQDSTEKFDDIRTVWEKMSACFGDGDYAHLFDNPEDTFDPHEHTMFGFDLTQIVQDNFMLASVTHYLMFRINTTLDGTPTLLVMDEAWDLLKSSALSHNIEHWLAELRMKNAIAIFATESVDGAEKSPITPILAERIKTKIFLPNGDANEQGYEHVFGLSHEEFELLLSMDPYYREFLLIHDIDAVIGRLNLKNLPFHLSVLSATIDELNAFYDVVEYYGNTPENWLPHYEEKLAS